MSAHPGSKRLHHKAFDDGDDDGEEEEEEEEMLATLQTHNRYLMFYIHYLIQLILSLFH